MLFHSTRGGDKDKDFASILMQGLADDGGLFMPDHWPQVNLEKIKGLQSFVEVAKEIVPLFTASSFTQEETIKIVENTWHDFEHQDLVGIKTIENISVLELFHGPTAAFKDFGLQLAAAFFNEVLEKEDKTALVLGAPKTRAVLSSFSRTSLKNAAASCKPKSLKAAVGPWNNSNTDIFSMVLMPTKS